MSKITKEVNDVTVEFCTNGFVLKASGRDDNDDWVEDKIICLSLIDLTSEINNYRKFYDDK
jgi:hypothetical protein